MKLNKGSLWSMLVVLLASTSAMAAQPTCSNVNAIINPGNQTLPEVNNLRVPTSIILDGINSNPKDKVTCSWTQAATDTQQVTIVNPNSCTASFNAPDVGPSGKDLHFQLLVTSTENGCTNKTDTKNTTITVTNVITNRAPVASAIVSGATSPYAANEGMTVTLDGSASSDPDGDILTYTWVQVIDANNPSSPVTITTDNTGKFATFTAPPEQYPNGETLTFRLTVSDGFITSSTDILITVQSVNQPPLASIGYKASVNDVAIICPVSVTEGALVVLDGIGSSDPDLGTLTYQWSQISGAPNANLSGVDLMASSIAFLAPTLTSFPYDTMTFGLTVTDNGNLSSTAKCDVKVLDVTPPVISGTDGITKEATSASGAVATFAPTAYDAFDGDVAVTCAPESGSIFGLGTTPVICSASDKAGNKVEATFNVTVVDTTPPLIAEHEGVAAEATGPSGAVVSYTSPETSDAVDGTGTAICLPASGSTFALGTTTVTCNATDKAGNAAIATTFNITVQDTTPPALTLTGPSDQIEGNTLGGATVTYTTSASDLVDGSVAVTCDRASGSVFPVGDTTVTCSASDVRGNKAAGSFVVTVKDTTAPVITFAGSIAEGDSFIFGSVPAAPTCTAIDVVSGTVPCTVSDYSTLVGTHVLAATATDKAGNTAKATRSYTVLAWTLLGFYGPLDMNGASTMKNITKTVKGGSTVPMKFEVFAGPEEKTSTTAISSIKTLSVNCSSLSAVADEVPVEALATGGTALRYDTTAGQFIFNWQTPKLPGKCYVVTATTLDGSTISANFMLK
ncbi:MAG TPA: HYR domain-containing protein [Geobacteraceae bacterium]|nr:HYR domain-containing protein [Geobacteraceae bacterium]